MDMEIINGVRITLLPDNGGGIILSYYAQDCPSPEKMARIQAILHDKSIETEDKIPLIKAILQE